ncbi:MAG TPA: TIGR03557 family F420-dependent LLM class oxidoreductase [Solirubrobacteraceae bacterium]|nr:TIGR03557 family F420-dependent LLM class oxidoreductase [Solirubrobacteraceae bacterium]
MKIGYFLSSEEYSPSELVRQAGLARRAGVDRLWISDHLHPWNEAQGHSGFVWSTIGAIAAAVPGVRVTTAVTCPTVRQHPLLVAHAAATCAVLLDGRFQLGVGSGEALNEHVLAGAWPSIEPRLAMLEEAVTVIRALWQGGSRSHCGEHYRIDNARIYDLPVEPIPILVSGFGPRSTDLAARIGDGYCTVSPDPELIERFRAHGGERKPVQAGAKVCIAGRADDALDLVARRWPNEALPGELAQVLPTPAHFEQACTLVTRDMVAESVPHGPGLDQYVAHCQSFADAGVDELFLQQIGDDQEAFFDGPCRELLARFNT